MSRLMMVGILALVVVYFPTLAMAQAEIPLVISGCTTPGAINFNPSATVSDQSCLFMPVMPPMPPVIPPIIPPTPTPSPVQTTPSTVSIVSPLGTVSGMVNFEAQVTFGTNPALTDGLNWAVYSGDCDDQGELMAGNSGDFNNVFTYTNGQFRAVLDTTLWPQGVYCFKINPFEAGSVADTVNASVTFTIGLNTIYGQKYEDVDGDGRLNYEIDQLVADYPIIATNEETGQVFETVTDGEGTYTFSLPRGVWTISEGEKRGWSQIRAYTGRILIDKGQDEGEITQRDCTIDVGGDRGFGFGKGSTCTFLNEQVSTGSSGTKVRPSSDELRESVLGVATSTAPRCEGMYLTAYLREGQSNPTDQVIRLQVFLNALGFTTAITGTFDSATTAAVRAFQERYLTEVLLPWDITAGTGYVFKTTRATINNMVCPGSEAIPVI